MLSLPTPPSTPIIDTHQLEWDPPAAITAVSRWTCASCGDAVLDNRGYVYGGATTTACTQPTGGDR
ncbi:hypothetical protein P3T27_006534 [Kitasatospora sp. MAA19]|uniref:hypothetical protein n=1 Tax=Kitasatospora sp. MAA19 TaxID=3035090 RepID=UPI002474A4C6|nr:hypothetical protein [Kitasatospora sp. MAA19]MDH6709785.1 hypothetical protein [Kitasatospora sp. MAA19]